MLGCVSEEAEEPMQALRKAASVKDFIAGSF
jgi:hypothetical protein